ncbi:MAG TPA: DEAD/DEAH box helicase [Candidatus Saccharimonadales bacterium]
MSYSYRSRSARATKTRAPYGRPNRSQKTNNRRKAGQYIDPKRFVATATLREVAPYIPLHAFSDFALDALLKENLAAKGYETPTPIQDQSIPIGLTGQDIIGLAGTGTGKTAAFALPVLHRLLTQPESGALIVAPTRELAQQIEQECRELGKGSGLKGALLIGGTSMGPQLRDLRAKPRIVIGTPGRIKDHLERGSLKLQHFDTVVLDEVDRMLDMGFVNDIRTIIAATNNDRQCFLFSATMDNRVRTLIDDFAHEPVTVAIQTSVASENVNQDVVHYQAKEEKMSKLHDLLIDENVAKVIIFDQTQRSVERLSKELVERGFKADAIHGGKSQGQRQRALTKFKSNHVSILVATDVAARGIDVADITHVVNYSVPDSYDDYVHRIGRAGRAGRIGHAFTFVGRD